MLDYQRVVVLNSQMIDGNLAELCRIVVPLSQRSLQIHTPGPASMANPPRCLRELILRQGAMEGWDAAGGNPQDLQDEWENHENSY